MSVSVQQTFRATKEEWGVFEQKSTADGYARRWVGRYTRWTGGGEETLGHVDCTHYGERHNKTFVVPPFSPPSGRQDEASSRQAIAPDIMIGLAEGEPLHTKLGMLCGQVLGSCLFLLSRFQTKVGLWETFIILAVKGTGCATGPLSRLFFPFSDNLSFFSLSLSAMHS